MRLPTRSAILFAKHWFLEIDGYAVEYVRDGSCQSEGRPSDAQVERLDVLPEKLRNMGGLAIDQDI
jgi:hypothetical protein